MIYVDGSALVRFLPGMRFAMEWAEWFIPVADQIATTPLGLTELRQFAELYPRESKDEAFRVVERVRSGVMIIRFSDDTVSVSTHAISVLKPFAALHLGAAVAHPQIDSIATYDPELAKVAALYQLRIIAPGLPDGWQNRDAA